MSWIYAWFYVHTPTLVQFFWNGCIIIIMSFLCLIFFLFLLDMSFFPCTNYVFLPCLYLLPHWLVLILDSCD